MNVDLVFLAIAKALAPVLLAVLVSGVTVYRREVLEYVRGGIDDLAERWHDRRLAMDRIEWAAGRPTYPAGAVVRR